MVRFLQGFRFFVLMLISAFVLFNTAGCNKQNQEAVGLYVDAVMLSEQNKKVEAVDKLNMAIEKDPKFSIAYSMLGDIYWQMADYENSSASYKKATELNPWSFHDFHRLGKNYHLMQNFAEAAQAYVSACDLEPEHFDAHLDAAKAFYQLQDYDQAVEYGTMARMIDPSSGEAEKILGDVYGVQKDNAQAIDAYKRALELNGNDPSIMTPLALAYLRSGRYDAGRELLVSVINIEPQNGAAYKYLGFAYLRLKQMDEASESYSKAVEIDENDWGGHKGLGVVNMMMSQGTEGAEAEELKAKALEHWSRSLDIKPTQSKLLKLYQKYSKE